MQIRIHICVKGGVSGGAGQFFPKTLGIYSQFLWKGFTATTTGEGVVDSERGLAAKATYRDPFMPFLHNYVGPRGSSER